MKVTQKIVTQITLDSMEELKEMCWRVDLSPTERDRALFMLTEHGYINIVFSKHLIKMKMKDCVFFTNCLLDGAETVSVN